jgi:Response regulator receiver domain
MLQAGLDPVAVLRMLVVDDSAVLRDHVGVALEDAGLTVVGEAADGAYALTQAATRDPDVVLMDLRMPGDGWHPDRPGPYGSSSRRRAWCCGPGGRRIPCQRHPQVWCARRRCQGHPHGRVGSHLTESLRGCPRPRQD